MNAHVPILTLHILGDFCIPFLDDVSLPECMTSLGGNPLCPNKLFLIYVRLSYQFLIGASQVPCVLHGGEYLYNMDINRYSETKQCYWGNYDPFTKLPV